MIVVPVSHTTGNETTGDELANKILQFLRGRAATEFYRCNIDWFDAVALLLAEYDAVRVIGEQNDTQLVFNTDSLYTLLLLQIDQQ